MKRETETAVTNAIDEATALLAVYRKQGKHTVKFPVYINQTAANTDIEALDLTQRPYNSLKRAGIQTVAELMESIESTQDLLRHRNLGAKSATEIMYKIYLYQYRVLSQERKDEFLRKVIELNK